MLSIVLWKYVADTDAVIIEQLVPVVLIVRTQINVNSFPVPNEM